MPETSEALGFGFRCGFLGLLHMQIVQERLEREEDMDLVQTAPNVVYQVRVRDGEMLEIHSPGDLPDGSKIDALLEPIVNLSVMVLTPTEHIGAVMKLAIERRGKYVNTEFVGENRQMLHFEVPLSEIIYDFHDTLKSVTRGLRHDGLRVPRVPRVRPGQAAHPRQRRGGRRSLHDRAQGVGTAARPQDHREAAQRDPADRCSRSRCRQPSTARSSRARTSAPCRKNVTAKCYGGDISRKRKLLEKQKEGKKRMKMVGNVEIPQKAFLVVLQSGDEKK